MEECAICLNEIKGVYKKTKCNHIFHEECIVKWYKVSHRCPLCRNSVFNIKCDELEDNYWRRVQKMDEYKNSHAKIHNFFK